MWLVRVTHADHYRQESYLRHYAVQAVDAASAIEAVRNFSDRQRDQIEVIGRP